MLENPLIDWDGFYLILGPTSVNGITANDDVDEINLPGVAVNLRISDSIKIMYIKTSTFFHDNHFECLVRIPVPNEQSCHLGLSNPACEDCKQYYDATYGYGNNDAGKCVWVPDKRKCYAKLLATGGAPNFNDWSTDFDCFEPRKLCIMY